VIPGIYCLTLTGGKCLFDSDNVDIPKDIWCLVITVEVKSVNCLVLECADCEGNYRRVGFARLRRVANMQALLSSFHISTITVI
jgi:hypothetical protein